MSENVIQCRLTKEQDGHKVVLITWVPQNLAVKNKKVKLESTGEIFIITELYTMKDKKSATEDAQNYRRARKFSDV